MELEKLTQLTCVSSYTVTSPLPTSPVIPVTVLLCVLPAALVAATVMT